MGSVSCFRCQSEITFQERLYRKDECPKCGEDARVCKNCEFYDVKVYNECRETQADRVQEKERSTLCDFFRPREASGDSPESQAEKLRKAAEALFKKS